MKRAVDETREDPGLPKCNLEGQSSGRDLIVFFTWLEVYWKIDANGLVQKKVFNQLFPVSQTLGCFLFLLLNDRSSLLLNIFLKKILA